MALMKEHRAVKTQQDSAREPRLKNERAPNKSWGTEGNSAAGGAGRAPLCCNAGHRHSADLMLSSVMPGTEYARKSLRSHIWQSPKRERSRLTVRQPAPKG